MNEWVTKLGAGHTIVSKPASFAGVHNRTDFAMQSFMIESVDAG